MRRIGVLLPGTADDTEYQARMAAFLQGLQQLGWSDGRYVRIDIRYVENWSLVLDLMIMWRTVGAVLRGSGAY